jgi:transcriptional regulator with XRE-family HTH domain
VTDHTDARLRAALVTLRKRAGLTQIEMGTALGIPPASAQGSISRMETGAVGMDITRLCAYLAVCGASLADLADAAGGDGSP